MKAHQLSGSKVDLALLCAYWCRTEIRHPARPMGRPALRGVAVHKASDHHHKKIELPTLDDEERGLWLSLKGWIESQDPYSHSELAILYDAENDTSSICETGIDDRDYLGVTSMKVPMRLDLVRLATTLHVLDIKTGSKSNTEPEATNVQLATQGVGASRLFGANNVFVGLVFPMKTKVHAPKWHVMNDDALDEHAGRLRALLRTIPTSSPEKGSHCWRCPIGPTTGYAATCPAWAQENAA